MTSTDQHMTENVDSFVTMTKIHSDSKGSSKETIATKESESSGELKKKKKPRSIFQPTDNKRLRRSPRDTQRLVMPHKTSLAYRRLEELFFRESCSRTTETVTLGHFKLERVHSSPNIYVIESFLTQSEIKYFQRRSKGSGFRKSFVDRVTSSAREASGVDHVCYDDQHRTSTFVSYTKGHDSTIAAVERRAMATMSCSHSALEGLQLVRYKPGQFFGVHHDLGDYDETEGTVELPRKSSLSPRRLVTIFCYINETKEGGATHFPAADGLRVNPKPGRAVLFSNILQSGLPDPRTIHEGESSSSTKYGVNIWICEDSG